MSQALIEIVFIFLLLIANGIFAMSEIAVVSARKARLQQRANAGNPRAQAALNLANAPGKFLATVQIGITLVGIFAGAYGGATIAEQIADYLETIPPLAPYGETIGLLVVVVAVTYFSLIIGELVPKQIGLNQPETIASLVARPMRVISWVAAPIVAVLNASTGFVLWVLRVKPSDEPAVTEEEIKVMISQATKLGMFAPAEQTMVERVFRLGDLQIGALITPRTAITSLELTDTVEEIRAKVAADRHTWFPVIEDSLDEVIGVVHIADLFTACLANQPLDLKSVLQQPLFFPETISALKVLHLLRDRSIHMALIIDEYGGIQGLVTIDSILEKIIADVVVPFQQTEPQALLRNDGSWLLDGLLPIDELQRLLNILNWPEEQDYQTLGGFVMAQIERIPTTGDSFQFDRYQFEIVDMDGHRVDKVLATVINPNETSQK
jgi:putative hemolysin